VHKPQIALCQRSDCSISSSCLSMSVNSIARRRNWRTTAALELGFTPPASGPAVPRCQPGHLGDLRPTIDLVSVSRGVAPKPTTDRGNILLSESTVRTSLKITSAVTAALAFSLAGAGTALADTMGADASGGGDFGFDVSGPPLPPLPPPPAPPMASASASEGTTVGADTPFGSADGGLSTGLGINLGVPTLPPPPSLPAPTASASGGTGIGVDTPLGSADGGLSTGFGVGLPTLPPPPPPPPLPSASGSAQTNLGFGF
jgi:hypothetical protein